MASVGKHVTIYVKEVQHDFGVQKLKKSHIHNTYRHCDPNPIRIAEQALLHVKHTLSKDISSGQKLVLICINATPIAKSCGHLHQ